MYIKRDTDTFVIRRRSLQICFRIGNHENIKIKGKPRLDSNTPSGMKLTD